MGCDRFDCTNKDKSCLKCFDYTFYSPPKVKKGFQSSYRKKDVPLEAEDSWKGLEAQVARDISKVPDYYNAHRQLMSGALWFKPGDIEDPVAFFECKERKGNIVESKGTKSFTIELGWIEKGEEEAKRVDKPFFLPFRFKGNPVIRVVTEWRYIAELMVTLKSTMAEVDKCHIMIRALKKQIKDLGGKIDESDSDT